MLGSIYYLFSMGLCNVLRGSGTIPKVLAYTLMTLITAVTALPNPAWHIAVIFGLLWLGFAPGWGVYFACISGKNEINKPEFFIVDNILKLFNFKSPENYGTVGMSLRWVIMFMPLFLFLLKPVALLILAMAGPLYLISYKSGVTNWTVLAEFLTGVLLGICIIY